MDRFRLKAKKKQFLKWAAKYSAKLTEVENAKREARQRAFRNGECFVDALQAKGFHTLGSGAFSTVLAHPDNNDKVVKVIYRPQQDGWVDYAHWAGQKGYAGTFAPRVFSYKLVKSYSKEKKEYYWSSPQDFGVAVMERLDKTLTQTEMNADGRVLHPLFKHAMSESALAVRMLDSVVPGLANFAKDLKKDFEDERFDLHDGNMMLRKDGSFVVTDPICHMVSKIAHRRLKTSDFSSSLAA